ncbi:hypothetical protein BC938DRAFT_472541 [Jimgerdemannia flammicorona]|uniref:Uncharacterized protein n=1 Tax=Jimgerdemannia flammicorona TaxID=994334 RepID=A0A433QTV1_9FUNG|nr:hypothetical protein BC938DRAFT_472541 [Jimgerdemannia flammicorona]
MASEVETESVSSIVLQTHGQDLEDAFDIATASAVPLLSEGFAANFMPILEKVDRQLRDLEYRKLSREVERRRGRERRFVAYLVSCHIGHYVACGEPEKVVGTNKRNKRVCGTRLRPLGHQLDGKESVHALHAATGLNLARTNTNPLPPPPRALARQNSAIPKQAAKNPIDDAGGAIALEEPAASRGATPRHTAGARDADGGNPAAGTGARPSCGGEGGRAIRDARGGGACGDDRHRDDDGREEEGEN